jgi:hypothetical protein
LDAETVGRLMLDQIAGLGLTAFLAKLVVTITSTPSAVLVERLEAWNVYGATTGDYAPPVIARLSAGVFTITYPSEVVNTFGVSTPLVFRDGLASYRATGVTTPLHARVEPTNPASSIVTVRGWNDSDVPTDGTFAVWLS